MKIGSIQDYKFSVVDLETTGFSPAKHEIVEICVVQLYRGQVINVFETFVKPQKPVSFPLTRLHGIDNDMLMLAPEKEEVVPKVIDLLSNTVLVEHSKNGFDSRFLESFLKCKPWSYSMNTLELAKTCYPRLAKYDLPSLCRSLSIELTAKHTARGDAEATAQLFKMLIPKIQSIGFTPTLTSTSE